MIAIYKSIDFIELNYNLSILIKRLKQKTSIVSFYIDNFFIASNIMALLNFIEIALVKKYNTKKIREVKTIIRWQIT